ncbi:MAG: methionine biosynthesis protein MetW [Verrucomicrobiota bacterium]
MSQAHQKRQVDFQVIAEWVDPGSTVLDLGCGRGVLLEFLKTTKDVFGVGVDVSQSKATSCVKRGIPIFQGDVDAVLNRFSVNAFDRVIFSRTVEELQKPQRTLSRALEVGRSVTVGFINHGFWVNRFNLALFGKRTVNEVYPKAWQESRPRNPFSLSEFEGFCREEGIAVRRRRCLSGNWTDDQKLLPNLLAGYVIYDLEKES